MKLPDQVEGHNREETGMSRVKEASICQQGCQEMFLEQGGFCNWREEFTAHHSAVYPKPPVPINIPGDLFRGLPGRKYWKFRPKPPNLLLTEPRWVLAINRRSDTKRKFFTHVLQSFESSKFQTKIIWDWIVGAISESFDATMIVDAFDLHVQRGLDTLSYSSFEGSFGLRYKIKLLDFMEGYVGRIAAGCSVEVTTSCVFETVGCGAVL
ncbi:hypothetical protein TWF718_002126 [Orbilia javanica]|uniref:Uncharacterized protein n=1 Tax=Orbilia javanica TaxID=47235 RepID=A0AAN8R9L9_9PEZI